MENHESFCLYKFTIDENGDRYSSVKLQKQAKKAPISVHIVTPQNITEVTADMHRNALTTLGLEHADITIASPIEASPCGWNCMV